MAKRVPKHIIEKMERANAMMEALVRTNLAIEEWLEKNGVTDYGFEYLEYHRDTRGYAYFDVDVLVGQINDDLEGEA